MFINNPITISVTHIMHKTLYITTIIPNTVVPPFYAVFGMKILIA